MPELKVNPVDKGKKTANPKGVRSIAFYLPQFHPTPENDDWWGRGFTEWTNTAKAKPLFKGHYQPHVPADLGFYDLRLPETRAAQAVLAREHGIEAFCYYHYWFGNGRRVLQRPFDEVLATGEPNFPFCLCWANQTWTGIWHGAGNRVLVEQTYPGINDHRAHFELLLKAFRDPRYVRVEGMPLFMVYNPNELPDSKALLGLWRQWAVEAGLPGLYLVAEHKYPDWDPQSAGFDASIIVRLPPRRTDLQRRLSWRQPVERARYAYKTWKGQPTIHGYEAATRQLITPPVPGIKSHPCAIPNWDNTPRSGANGMLLLGSTPELFRQHLTAAISRARQAEPGRQLLFIKSWNEWAEGNHLEPDLRFGRRYLEVLRDALYGST